jgi:hypothetical protein
VISTATVSPVRRAAGIGDFGGRGHRAGRWRLVPRHGDAADALAAEREVLNGQVDLIADFESHARIL